MFGEVPALPVVVPLGGLVVAISMWNLRRRGLLTAPRAAVALALGVYTSGIVANTLFPIFLDKPTTGARWTQFIDLVPVANYEVADAVMNVCVFVPVGVLIPLIAPRWAWWRVLAATIVLSLAIEVSQYATAHLLGGGHIADVDDLLANVTGGALGLLLLHGFSRVPVFAALISRFRWS